MSEQWHVGRTVGRTLYKGDGPADMVGVMVGPHDEACERAQQVVRVMNEHTAVISLLEALLMALDGPGAHHDGYAKVLVDGYFHRSLRGIVDAARETQP